MNTYMLLIALLFCHFLADFTALSTPKMLAAKRNGDPKIWILAHASVHGALMAFVLILFGVTWQLFFLVPFQVLTHYIIDLIKATLGQMYPSLTDPKRVSHWILFGGDQFMHQLVIVGMVVYATPQPN